jgi:hypothetical protein
MTNNMYFKEPKMPKMDFEPMGRDPYRNANLFSDSTRQIWDTRERQRKTVRQIRKDATKR